jgi:3-oxoadipate enol-lactonase
MPTAILNGLNFYYRVDGEGPRTFLFFNGAGLTTKSWQDVAPALVKLGRLVRFDARGCGQTDTPSAPFTMEDMAADALSLIDHLDIPQVIAAGHAFGGRIAQIFTRDHPERVSALVLCGTGGKYPPLTKDLDTKAADPNTDNAARVELFFARWFGSQFRRKHPERAERVMREMLGGTGTTAAQLAPRRSPQIAPVESYWAKVPASIPVLLIYGTADRYGHAANRDDLHRQLQNSKLVLIEGAGHLAIREEPEQISAEIIKFVGEKNL